MMDKLLIYTDNCGGENKNRWFLNEVTDFINTFKNGVEVIMNMAAHNKWYFDRAGGRWKTKYQLNCIIA